MADDILDAKQPEPEDDSIPPLEDPRPALIEQICAQYKGLPGEVFDPSGDTDASFPLQGAGKVFGSVSVDRGELWGSVLGVVVGNLLHGGLIPAASWEEWCAQIDEDPAQAEQFARVKDVIAEPIFYYLLAHLPGKLNAALASLLLEAVQAVKGHVATTPGFEGVTSAPPSKIAEGLARVEMNGMEERVKPLMRDRRARGKYTAHDLLGAINSALSSPTVDRDSLFTLNGLAAATGKSRTTISNLLEREKLGRPEDLRKLVDGA